MKKVCHITTVHPAFDTRIFHKEAKTLVEAGYDVTLIVQHEKDEIIEGVKIIALPKPKDRWERFLKLDYLAYKKALQQKADIYHFHDPELLPWMVKLKKKTGAKLIYDVHEAYSKQILAKDWLPNIFRYFVKYVYTLLENWVIKFFDAVIVAGDDIKLKNSKIIVIKNYPFKTMGVRNVATQENMIKQFQCIYLGGVSKGRCIKEILQSLDYIKRPILITVIGPCEDRKYLQDLKNSIKIRKKHGIKFLAPFPHQEAIKYLKSANVGFVLFRPDPNNITAVSRNNKLYEYMAAGLPVIVSNFPLWRKFIEENRCGLCVNPLEPKEIAKAIEYLIEHPIEAKKMGENGRKAVLEKYNWEVESRKLLNVYKEVLNEKD